MGRVTTHVLDTALGRPASGLSIELFRLDAGQRRQINTSTTNADGRTDAPILDADLFALGSYELVFHAGDYLKAGHSFSADKLFLDEVPIRFTVFEDAHYHVPLLLSPFGYSTYRGS